MMQKLRTVLAVVLLLLLGSMTAFAGTDPNIKATVDNAAPSAVKLYVENRFITMPDGAAYITNGRTMVPVRFVSEALKYDVNWNQEAKTVTIKSGGSEVLLTIGSKLASKDGKEIQIDALPVLTDGRTYVPLRLVSEALGAEVNWDGRHYCVAINKEVPFQNVNIAKTIEQIWPDNIDEKSYKGFEDTTLRQTATNYIGGNGISTNPVGGADAILRFAYNNPIDESMLKLYLQYMVPNDWGAAYKNIIAFIKDYRMTNDYHLLSQYYSNIGVQLGIFDDNGCEIRIYKYDILKTVHPDTKKIIQW